MNIFPNFLNPYKDLGNLILEILGNLMLWILKNFILGIKNFFKN